MMIKGLGNQQFEETEYVFQKDKVLIYFYLAYLQKTEIIQCYQLPI